MVLITIDCNRYLEWKALFDYISENREELERRDRMRALVLCLQQHWQEAVKDIPDWF